MRVLIGEMVCPVIAAATGLNIRCTGDKCPAYDKKRELCDVGERKA